VEAYLVCPNCNCKLAVRLTTEYSDFLADEANRDRVAEREALEAQPTVDAGRTDTMPPDWDKSPYGIGIKSLLPVTVQVNSPTFMTTGSLASTMTQLIIRALNSGWQVGTDGHLHLPGDASMNWASVWRPVECYVGDLQIRVPDFLHRRLNELDEQDKAGMVRIQTGQGFAEPPLINETGIQVDSVNSVKPCCVRESDHDYQSVPKMDPYHFLNCTKCGKAAPRDSKAFDKYAPSHLTPQEVASMGDARQVRNEAIDIAKGLVSAPSGFLMTPYNRSTQMVQDGLNEVLPRQEAPKPPKSGWDVARDIANCYLEGQNIVVALRQIDVAEQAYKVVANYPVGRDPNAKY
jgi:hypothetical protein